MGRAGRHNGCPQESWEEDGGYHDALPRQVLVHKDMVGRETPEEPEARHFVDVALKPRRQSLRDHPPGVGEPSCRVQRRLEGTQSRPMASGAPSGDIPVVGSIPTH